MVSNCQWRSLDLLECASVRSISLFMLFRMAFSSTNCYNNYILRIKIEHISETAHQSSPWPYSALNLTTFIQYKNHLESAGSSYGHIFRYVLRIGGMRTQALGRDEFFKIP